MPKSARRAIGRTGPRWPGVLAHVPPWHFGGALLAVGTALILLVSGLLSTGTGPAGEAESRAAPGAQSAAGAVDGATAARWGGLRALERSQAGPWPIPSGVGAQLNAGPQWAAPEENPEGAKIAAETAAPRTPPPPPPPPKPRYAVAGPVQLVVGESAIYWLQSVGSGGRAEARPVWVVVRGFEHAWVDVGGRLYTRSAGTVVLRAVVEGRFVEKTIQVVPPPDPPTP